MSTKKKLMIVFFFFFVFMSFYLTSLARYKSSSVWNYYLESHGFYFSSDFLGNDVKNVDTLWDGNSVHFNLKNSINDSLITEYDIRYNVTCEVLSDIPATCNLNGTNNSTFTGVLSSNARCINDIDDTDVSSFSKTECEIKGYSWQNLVANQDIYFDIVPTQGYELNNVDVSIVVNSVSPYKKSISGTFSLFKNSRDLGSITKSINDYEDFDDLILTNSYDTRKCVNVKFDSSKRIVDFDDSMSNTFIDASGYIKEFNISIDGMSNKKIRFFNKDFSYNYSSDDFIIDETGC